MANSCETCKHYEVEAYNEPCVSCRLRDYDVPTKWENPFRQKTNADRIRAMSDEELANVVVCPHCKTNWDKCTDDCFACRLEWLKQPAEVEHG